MHSGDDLPQRSRDSRALTLLWGTPRWEQPACLVHEFLRGPLAGIGEVAIRIEHHPLRTVIMVLDGDVDRHVRRLPATSVSAGTREGTTADGHFSRHRNATPFLW
jgi:hypothetical protein